MDACTNHNSSVIDNTASACVTEIGKKRSSRVRKIASGCVFWICMALIGVVAVPAGVLLGLIDLIVRVMYFLTDRIEKK